MSLAASVSLQYIAGNTVELEFAVTDENDQPAIIAGDTVRFVIADNSGPVLSTDDESVTATITNPSGGIFRIEIDEALTEPLLGTYRFQAQLEDVSGDVATVSRGFITFSKNLLSAAS